MQDQSFKLAKQAATKEITDEKEQLLAELLGNKEGGLNLTESFSESEVKPVNLSQPIKFELVVPDWDMNKLSRSFFSSFKQIEDTTHKADQWVDETEELLKNLVETLPEVWPKRDSSQITSKFLGSFFGISQQHPISQYLDTFSEIPLIPATFPPLQEVQFSQDSITETPNKTKIVKPVSRPSSTLQNYPVTKIKLRAIGIYWLQYQHATQLQGTLRDAGDLYFVFLKAIQRLFRFPPGSKILDIKNELINDVQQLADNLRSTHRSHLMYIYVGFEKDLHKSVSSWKTFTLPKKPRLTQKIKKQEAENRGRLEKYQKALEYVLEDFYIRLQFIQIQRETQRIMDEEIQCIHQQYKQLQKQLNQTIDDIQKGVPTDSQEWEQLNKYMFAFQMENIETKFHDRITGLKNIYLQIQNNKRTNNIVNLALEKFEKVTQLLPEHADIIHLDKLWSWTHKRIEIDEAVPLRYTVEQFFYTRLYEKLNEYHQRWLSFIKSWSEQINHQEQFFLFSFFSLRQEWADSIGGWQTADREAVHRALKDNSHPTLLLLKKILDELEKEYSQFEQATNQTFHETINDLEDVIFDPGLRQKLLKLASEGSGIIAAILGLILNLGQANLVKQWPIIKKLLLFVEKTQARWLIFKASLKLKPPLPEFPLPTYYSRVFTVDPLEVSSLFIGREEEANRLMNFCDRADKKGRIVVGIIGIAGSGKRSLMDYFIRNNLDLDSVHIQMILSNNKIVAIINNRAFTLDRMIRKIQLDRFRVVILDGLETCFVETVGGAQPLLDFFEWLQKTARDIIWVISVNELAWKTIEQLHDTKGTFTHILHLDKMKKEHLIEMLYKRHHVVGLNLQFKVPNTRYFKLLNKFRPQTCHTQLETIFFNELDKRSMGNPAIALKLWSEQCKMLEDETIILDPLFDEEILPQLGEEELFLLRIILSQGRVGPKHLEPAVISSKSLRVSLDNLENNGLISISRDEEGVVFAINPNSYFTIYRLLQRALLIS